MPFVSRKGLLALAALGIAGTAVVAGAVWSGLYNVAADDPHSRPVYALLETVRERSIHARAADLQPPELDDAARIRQGAGNYAAMCAGCHGAPGQGETELQRGLYPVPPDLTRAAVDARAAFWVIKHGIKASGMPAWGRSMDDDYIWNLVAFTRKLPELDAAGYADLVASSEGHSHGGGESHPHGPPGAAAEASAAEPAGEVHVHDDGSQHLHAPQPAPKPTTHVHADGKLHEHAAEPAKPAPKPATHVHDDGELHEPAAEPAKPAVEDPPQDHDHDHDATEPEAAHDHH